MRFNEWIKNKYEWLKINHDIFAKMFVLQHNDKIEQKIKISYIIICVRKK